MLFEAAARANRQLALALRAQGLSDGANRFDYQAQTLERVVFWRQRRYGAYAFSLLLWALAGYGYRLGRIVFAYLSVVALFALGYAAADLFNSGALTLQQLADALQISLNAIHGRVFFAQFGLDTLQSWLATAESIAGIIIEGVLVAMIIQRFFAR